MSNVTIDQALQMAVDAFHSRRFPEAENICRQVLKYQPQQPMAHCVLGLTLMSQGRPHEGVQHTGQAAKLSPNDPEIHFHNATVLTAAGKPQDALASHQRALQLRPDYTDVLTNMGVILAEMDRTDEACQAFLHVVRLRPNDSTAHSNLGSALSDKGDLGASEASYRRALALDPKNSRAARNLGNLLLKEGRLEEAAKACQEAIRAQPNYARAHGSLALVYYRQGRYADALTAWQTALQYDPNDHETYSNLSMLFRDQGRFGEAVASARRALELRQVFPEAWNNLGNSLSELGQIDEAIYSYECALNMNRNFPEAANNLGTAYEKQGRLSEALDCYRKALSIRPHYRAAHDNLLIGMQYHAGITPTEILAEHERWAALHARTQDATPFSESRDPERILRIGYVSPDFKQHPIPYFIEPVLARHDRARYHVTAYVDAVCPDAITKRLRSTCDTWREVTGQSDAAVAERIRADGIDILVDLAVHAPQNRLPMFALQPAPVLLSYLGYAGTTGVPAIRYRITDAVVDPLDTPSFGTEELVRIPRLFCCYRPPAEAPSVSPLPAKSTGIVTFASLNRLAKITPEVIALWCRVLKAIPGSRMMLQANGLSDAAVARRIQEAFQGHGVAPERLLLHGWGSFTSYLNHFHQVDIGLDTFPFNGHTTTCHTLWMGVPVIVRTGVTPVSRVGSSLLSALGFHEGIAGSEDDYVQRAIDLANNLDRLAEIRATLRDRIEASPLREEMEFTRSLENAYRGLWRRWCSPP